MDEFMQAAIDEARQGWPKAASPSARSSCTRAASSDAATTDVFSRVVPSLHGEMDAFENAGRQPASVYRDCVLYTTLSPCAMCSGAILLYGIPKVVVGENLTFMGEEDLLRSRGVSVDVIQNADCIAQMRDFIAAHPSLWNEDIGSSLPSG